ncbi:hypothetical protein BMI79_07180 [Serratia oryzae]|uniref:Uncharacterized protein n=2 Tax=Serratia oryzae TaxID=2034155 RepID=A0A1S8CM62_9GAMM|nr:hypothetical protein BMI79_07180 [Serratia oryzae]
MRYSQGVGAEAEFNPLEKKATAKVAGHANFTLGEGKLEAAFYVPDRLGVSLLFPAKNNGVCNMGALRFAISGVFTGNVGASLGIEIGVEMDWSGEMAKGYGIKGRPAELSSAGLPGKRTMSLIDKAPKPDNKAGAEIGAFAGAQAGVNVGGAIEWYDPNPEGSAQDAGKDKVIDPKENKFTAIAKLEIGVTVQAGAGGSGVFYVTYIQSRFRIYCKASLCWGVGAKGNLGFEVDGNHFLAFMKSFMYMLRNVDYQKLSNMMARDSFAVLCSIPIIMAASGVQAVETMLRDAQDIINIIGKEIEDESKRVALMNSIIENPDQLKYTPPETKGAIIAQLIDTNWFDKNDPRNQNNNLLSLNSWKFGPLKLRKQAVFLSLKWVQSKADYNNIMQHLTPVPGQVKGDAKVNEQRVVKFLGMGEYNFPGFTNYGEKLAWLYESLPDQVAYDAPFKPIPEKRMEQYLAMLDKQHPNSTMTA